jgi:hypothetical protein
MRQGQTLIKREFQLRETSSGVPRHSLVITFIILCYIFQNSKNRVDKGPHHKEVIF